MGTGDRWRWDDSGPDQERLPGLPLLSEGLKQGMASLQRTATATLQGGE